ncbi:MBL fold metallo-hydrolase [Ilyomonas limi]|uniref:MBL fold metallo-hydrolase n=1 Tax=Ilyomonas limi TaxID=2575867 RepID=A0A4U3L355_9BACT|nr:MBL fold metallo-hydrolase [Ilyomonas limi]TKK69312.1 MBL fold metallo-hydrolase [Ilyomonas limi]
MQDFICTTCGVQYPPAEKVPERCIICEDDRQYVLPSGQHWTTLQRINQQYKNIIEQIAEGVYAIYTTPSFAIGQRAHLVQSPDGNILWDCITNIDKSTIAIINALGGIKAIAISHPHYFSTIVEWSKAFDDVPVYVNALDEHWLTRRSPAIQLWNEQELHLWDNIKLIRCGGHFPGAAVMYVPVGKGALFVGDTIQVTPGCNDVSFMYSYPNMIPLQQKDIVQIKQAIEHVDYNVMYGAFGKYITHNAKAAVKASIERYIRIYT